MREFEPEDTGLIFLQDGEVGLFVVEDAPTFRIVGGVDELAGFVFAEVKAALVVDLGDEGATAIARVLQSNTILERLDLKGSYSLLYLIYI